MSRTPYLHMLTNPTLEITLTAKGSVVYQIYIYIYIKYLKYNII